MSSNGGTLLSQEEIDALLSGPGQSVPSEVEELLEPDEIDAMREICNISMGSSSTTLSVLFNQQVQITSPSINVMSEDEFGKAFKPPYLSVKVDFTKGLSGFNIWIIKLPDTLVISDLMMGGEGTPSTDQITELEISAASEAITQMLATSATSLASMFNRTIDISPPQTKLINEGESPEELAVKGSLVIVTYQMAVGDIINTEITQVISLETAKEEVSLLMAAMETDTPANADAPAPVSYDNILTPQELDALGEVGNISTGSASTTLSSLLNQRVQITSPRVSVYTEAQILQSFEPPFMTVKVMYTEGIVGFNLWIVTLRDALIVADLMMGGEGIPATHEITELEISAASEAMNQMIGTSATSLSAMFNRTINISPPETKIFNDDSLSETLLHLDPLIVVSFRMIVGSVMDTEIMQIMSVETAKYEAELLLSSMGLVAPEQDIEEPMPEATPELKEEAPEQVSAKQAVPKNVPPTSVTEEHVFQAPPPEVNWDKINLILDVPLNVTVVLGRTKRPIKEVLGLTPGSVVELSSLVEEPVEILVNGTLVARGEVVVVNENFGVRIKNVITPQERIKHLVGQ